jgi:hypothetical protein
MMYADIRRVFGPECSSDVLWNRSPDFLAEVTDVVQVIVKPAEKGEGQVSARFPAKDLVALLGGKWPCSDNFQSIVRAICEKNHYPMPEPEIPGGGGKSMTAQGQTKKPGSHSQDRHN